MLHGRHYWLPNDAVAMFDAAPHRIMSAIGAMT
jgi:hypothetical protein